MKYSIPQKVLIRSFASALDALLKGLEEKLSNDYSVNSEDFKSGYSLAIEDIKAIQKELMSKKTDN